MVVFSCSEDAASCRSTNEPVTHVTEVFHKVCKSIIRMVVMSYIIGIVCLCGNKNCPISRRSQRNIVVWGNKLEDRDKGK